MRKLLKKVAFAVALVTGGLAAAAAIGWYDDNATRLPSGQVVVAAVAATVVVFLFVLERHRKELSEVTFRDRLLIVFMVHSVPLSVVLWWLQPNTNGWSS